MKTNTISFVILSALAFVAGSCNPNYDIIGMVAGQSPQPDVRFEHSMQYNSSHGSRDITLTTDEYCFYVGTDCHIDSAFDNTLSFLNAFKNDAAAPFALFLGDLINAKDNIPWVTETIKKACGTKSERIYLTAGNHDVYFNQWSEWKQHWGSSTYSFVVNTPNYKDLYICLETANGTLGTKQLRWLRQLLDQAAPQNYRHRIVFTHTHLFKKDESQGHTSNYALEETYELTALFAKYGIDWYLCGHDHSREITRHKGVTYITVDALEEHYPNAYYMIAYVGNDLQYRFVPVGKHDDL